MKTHALGILTMVGIILASSGCATRSRQLRIDMPGAPSTTGSGRAVRIESVRDERAFAASWRADRSRPYVEAKYANDAQTKSRAVAYFYFSPFKKSMYLLVEDQSVELVLQQALARAFAEAGYTVATAADRSAIPIRASVTQFWTWYDKGFSRSTIRGACEVVVKGDLPALQGGLKISTKADMPTMDPMLAVPSGVYQAAVQTMLGRATTDLKTKLTPPAAKKP